MKIKLFKHEAISDGYYSNGMARYRRENNKELEVRVNEFMADKKVVDIKYQEATHGNYEDMDAAINRINDRSRTAAVDYQSYQRKRHP